MKKKNFKRKKNENTRIISFWEAILPCKAEFPILGVLIQRKNQRFFLQLLIKKLQNLKDGFFDGRIFVEVASNFEWSGFVFDDKKYLVFVTGCSLLKIRKNIKDFF